MAKEIKLKQEKIPKELLEMKRVKGKKIKLKQEKYWENYPPRKFAGGGIAAGMRRFNRGGKV